MITEVYFTAKTTDFTRNVAAIQHEKYLAWCGENDENPADDESLQQFIFSETSYDQVRVMEFLDTEFQGFETEGIAATIANRAKVEPVSEAVVRRFAADLAKTDGTRKVLDVIQVAGRYNLSVEDASRVLVLRNRARVLLPQDSQ